MMQSASVYPAPQDNGPVEAGAAAWEATGLSLPEGMSFEQWEDVGGTLATMERAVNWWVGDWLNYGERQYGEKYTQAIEATGRRLQSLMNYASVAGRVPVEARRPALSWSAHRAVAYLDPADRDRLLDEAERKEWGSREIEAAVKDQTTKAIPPAKVEQSTRSGEIVGEIAPAPPAEVESAQEVEPVEELEVMAGVSLVVELENADAEIRSLQQLVESLQTTDHGKEIARLALKYNQLEGRLRQEITKANEAVKQAKYQGDLLKKIRGALGVERDGEIVAALMRRAA